MSIHELLLECKRINAEPLERIIAGYCIAGATIGLALDLNSSYPDPGLIAIGVCLAHACNEMTWKQAYVDTAV